MYFTREDILKIQKALLQLGIKDSEFKTAQLPLQEDDTITIVQNNVNRKVKISNIIGQFNILNRQDFINVSDMYDEHYITINEAIKLINSDNDDVATKTTAFYSKCINAIQGFTSVVVDAINKSMKFNYALLKKVAAYKPAKESFNIFESALGVL